MIIAASIVGLVALGLLAGFVLSGALFYFSTPFVVFITERIDAGEARRKDKRITRELAIWRRERKERGMYTSDY